MSCRSSGWVAKRAYEGVNSGALHKAHAQAPRRTDQFVPAIRPEAGAKHITELADGCNVAQDGLLCPLEQLVAVLEQVHTCLWDLERHVV